MSIQTAIFIILSALSFFSMIIKKPWTLIPARRKNPKEVWDTELFLETNMVITGIWGILFLAAAVVSMTFPNWVSLILGVLYVFLGRLSPVFGSWYSKKRLETMITKT